LSTTAGDSYTLTFWLFPASATDSESASFQQYLDGALAVDATNVAINGQWNKFSSNFTGSLTGIDTLLFQAYNANDLYFLDDISVTDNSVPEPGTLGLLALGLAAAGAASRRHRSVIRRLS
jgi:hypothetical protein